MSTKEIYNLLGLAMRAGKIDSGTEKILSGIKRKKYRLVLLATDTSYRTKDKMKTLAQHCAVPLYEWETIDELTGAIGKTLTVAVGITDPGFAKAIVKKLKKCSDLDANKSD